MLKFCTNARFVVCMLLHASTHAYYHLLGTALCVLVHALQSSQCACCSVLGMSQCQHMHIRFHDEQHDCVCNVCSGLQDNNGNVNDEVVAGDAVGQRIIDAIAAQGGPAYTFVEIAPVDDQDGGIPGGNIRVTFLYRADKVELAASEEGRIGEATEAVAVVATDGDVRLSVNPGAPFCDAP